MILHPSSLEEDSLSLELEDKVGPIVISYKGNMQFSQ